MSIPDEKILALFQKMDSRLGFSERGLQQIKAELAAKANELDRKLTDVSSQGMFAAGVGFREKKMAMATRVIPFFYGQEVAIAGGTVNRTPLTINTDNYGWFFAERIWMSWRVTAAVAQFGRWRPISSDNAFVAGSELVAGGLTVDLFNFYWEYAEGTAQFNRQRIALPSTMLYRGDMDGFIPGSDGWAPATSVTFNITPIGTGPTNAGILNVTVGGMLCLNIPGVA